MLITGMLVTILAALGQFTGGTGLCPLSIADQSFVEYRDVPGPAGNTAVFLVTWCVDAQEADEYYIGFFHGDQPTLQEWYYMNQYAGDLASR